MRLRIEQKIQAGFALALSFLLLIAVAAWWSAERNLETFRAADRSYQVLDQLEDILVEMLNMETGNRGFALSGDEVFLEPYLTGVASVQKSFDAAKRLTRDNSGQQQRLAALEPLMRRKIGLMDAVIRLRRAGDGDAARQLVATGGGKQVMDEIRRSIGEMEAKEEQLLQTRSARAQATADATIGIVSAGSLVALLLVGLSGLVVRRDFRKRRQAEAERDRFFTVSLDMLCIASSDGFFKRVNPAFTLTLGWSAEEILRRPLLEFVHPDDRAATLREIEKQVVAGETVLLFENRYQHKDGSWRVLSWKSVPQAGGLMYASARDVTELKRMEESLRRSEENLAVTLNSIGDAVLATNTDGHVTRMNPIAEKLMGLTQAEALGRPVAEVFHILNEETRQSAVIPVDVVLATGEIHGLANHTILISRDGTERPIADSAAPIRDKHGRILGVVLVFRDVTEERKAEKTIRESEQSLRTLNEELERRVEERTVEIRQALATLDATADAAIIFDPDTLRFTYINQGTMSQVGYTREELLKKTVLDVQPELDEVRFRQMIAPLRSGPQRAVSFTTVHRHKDGREIPVEINLQYVEAPGKQPRFIYIARDITERLKHERLALRSQRLEAIGTLAGGVAHDLNNALAPIMMSVELLRMQYPGESRMLDRVQSSAKRGADMVRQLLTFAKGAEGDRVSINPKHLLKEMLNITKATFPKNIQVATKCDEKLPTVRGDATQLHQVLLNLCVNARDAMPNGGALTLEAHTREVDTLYASSVPDAKPGKYVALRVRDTGTGIPPEVLDRIFEPFFTTKGPEKGTGLGLSTVMGIVKGHGGFLQVYSSPGQGSSFTAYLPADHTEAGTEQVKKTGVEFRGNGETVLFVDDEVALRDTARAVLRRLNFSVVTATDGADGLMQAAEHRTDLRAVITDLHMPHMDGLAFVRAIRRMLPAIPVVVASGRLGESEGQELNGLGVNAYLDKPFTEAQLAEMLGQIFAPK